MKNLRILLAMITIVTLIPLDTQAAGPDGLLAYGLAFRALIWIIIGINAIMLYEGVRSIAQEIGHD
jgi:hypothetical protein